MLNYNIQRTLPLALWEQVKYGQDIGIDVSRDFICPECWKDGFYSKVACVKTPVEYLFQCSQHGILKAALPEYTIESSPKFHGQYESSLIERKRKVNQSLVVRPASPMTVQEAELTKMRGIVRSAIFGLGQDLGKYTEDVIQLVAHGALIHGLNPATGEIFPYIERDKDDNIVKISLGINYKGLSRSARRQSPFNIPWQDIKRLSPEEIRVRGLHQVPNWAYFRANAEAKKTLSPIKEYPPEQCIAVEVPLYRLDVYEKLLNLAERAKAVGAKPIPVTEQAVGLGVWRPGDSIPAGRTAEWRAILRGIKDAIQKAYDLDFALVSMYTDKGDDYHDQNAPFVINVEEGTPQHFAVEEIMAEQEIIEPVVQINFPGELLTQPKQNGLLKILKKEGISNPERFIQEVFGENIGMGNITDIMANNLDQICRRLNLLGEGKLTAESLGYAGLSKEALPAALRQEAYEKSRVGQKMVDPEPIKDEMEQLPK